MRDTLHEDRGGSRRFAGNVLSSTVGQVITLALAIGTTIVTSRWLGASGRGVLSLVVAGATLAGSVFAFGIPQALTTFVARRELSVRRGTLVAAVIAGATAALTFAGVALFAERLGLTSDLVRVFVPAGGAAVSFGLAQIAMANGIGRIEVGVANTVSTAALLLIGYVAGWLVGIQGASAVLLACAVWVAGQVIGDIVGISALLSCRSPKPTGRVTPREMTRFSLAAYPSILVGQLNARADILLLGLVASTAAVGIYSAAVVSAGVVFVIPGALGASLARPLGDDARGSGRLARMSAWGAVASAAVLGPLIALALVPLGPALLGEAFSDLATIVAIMVPGMALFASAYPTSVYFTTGLKRPSLNTGIATVAVGVDLALLAVLGPRYGAMGAAAAASLGYAVAGLLNLVLLVKLSRTEQGTSKTSIRGEIEESFAMVWSSTLRVLSR